MTYLIATEVGQKFNLVGIRIDMVLQIFNTIVLFLFLRHFLFDKVTNFMKERSDGIQASIDDADKKVREAEALKSEYEAKLSNIRDEELEILKNARIAAENRTKEMIKDAQREIDNLRLKAQDDIERERISTINQLKDDISSLAILAASKVINSEIDGAKHTALIDDVIEKVGEKAWQN